jgi:hypothetical protein
MTPPEKNMVRHRLGQLGRQAHALDYERGWHRPIFPHHWLKQKRLRQSLLADTGRGDLLKTIIAYHLEKNGSSAVRMVCG